MTLSNFLATPDGVVSEKNSGDPESDETAPGSVQIRRLEDEMVVMNGWVG
jgi:hypothetical protein